MLEIILVAGIIWIAMEIRDMGNKICDSIDNIDGVSLDLESDEAVE